MNTFLKSLIDSGPKFLFGALGGIIGFFAGVWKYDRDQKWQRAQVILNLMDAFKADPLIQAACIMLDWDQRSIRLPDGGQIEFENKILLKALNLFYMHASENIPWDRVRTSKAQEFPDETFTLEETLIRDCFDRFFDFFDKLYAFRTNELLTISDLRYFNYWFELVRKVGKYKNNEKIQDAFDNYIKAYSFGGFQKLSKEYGLTGETRLQLGSPSQSTIAGKPNLMPERAG